MKDAFSTGAEHPLDEDLLELALDPSPASQSRGLRSLESRAKGAASTREHVEACPLCRARIEDLCGFTGRVRSLLKWELQPDSPQIGSLQSRVLAATTREDLGWRGDLHLVGRFMRERLRNSAWVRIAAASLFIHVAALPVLAWVFLAGEGERGFQTDVIAPDPPGPLETDEPRWEPQPMEFASTAPEQALLEGVQAAGLAQRNALRWARWQLSQGGPPLPADPPTTSAGQLLARRARVLRGQVAALDPPAMGAGRQRTSWWVEVLEAEIELDRWVLAGMDAGQAALPVPPRTAALASEWLTATDVVRRERPLLLALLHRASAYGLLSRKQKAALRDFERSASGRATPEALQDPLRPDAPLDSAWITALEQALPEEAKDDPVVRAWLSWRL